MVKKNSHVPVYWQIKEDIYSQIISGELKPNERIPSEPKLAKKYNVSRLTARNAVTALVNDGYLFRVQGQGTFVKQPRVEASSGEFTGFMEDMRRRGFTVRSEVISSGSMPVPEELCEPLALEQHEEVYRIRRLRYANEEPIVLQETYLVADKCTGIDRFNLETESIYQHLREDYQLEIGIARESLEAQIASEENGGLLRIDRGAPILFSKRLTFLSNGLPIEFCYSWYRGDRYVFELELK